MKEATNPKAVWKRPPVVRLLLIAFFAELGVAVLNVLAMPAFLERERGHSAGLIGAVLVAFLLSENVFKPFFGHLTDKFGRRLFLILGPAILTITPLLTLLVPIGSGYGEGACFIALRIVDGIAAAMMWPAAYAAVGESVAGHERSQAMGLLNLCFMMGLALGAPVGGALNGLTGNFHSAFFLASGMFLVAAVFAFLFAPGKSAKETAQSHESDMHLKDLVVCLKSVPGVLILGFFAFLAVGFPAAIVQLFALNQYGLSQTQFGMVVLVAAAIMALFSVPLGKAGERIGRIRAVRLGLFLCMVGAWMIGTGFWYVEMRTVSLLAVGAALIGLGFLLAIPAWYSNVSHIDHKRSGSYLAAVMTAQGIGAIIGAGTGSKLYELEPHLPFIACAIALTVAVTLSLINLDRNKDPENLVSSSGQDSL